MEQIKCQFIFDNFLKYIECLLSVKEKENFEKHIDQCKDCLTFIGREKNITKILQGTKINFDNHEIIEALQRIKDNTLDRVLNDFEKNNTNDGSLSDTELDMAAGGTTWPDDSPPGY